MTAALANAQEPRTPEGAPMPPTPEQSDTDYTKRMRRRMADALDTGGTVTDDHTLELARGLLEIAGLAMPDTYFATDTRCQLARSVLARLRPGPPLDDFAKDVLGRCRWARQNNDGHPAGVWSTGEQLAVAVILDDTDHLAAMGYTSQEATVSVAGRMIDPPADINAWVAAIRTHLEAQR